jgi:glyoxylase-like metal-dependent hydrolase (beta-lactamase superfamily II)
MGRLIMELADSITRRNFLARTSQMGALLAASRMLPLPAIAESLVSDSRVAQTPLVDKGFAAVWKVGNGLYATISNTSKGMQTLCNGGFLVGKDSALLVEGFVSPAGASFQMDALRMVSQLPVKGALDSHYHFDHSMGNAVYGASGIPVWAHAATAKRIYENYGVMQGADKAAVLAPFEQRVRDAKTELARKHAQEYAAVIGNIYDISNSNTLSLPNRPLDPAKLPLKIDLGGLTAVVESYPGHSGTDIVVRVPEQDVVYTGDLLFNGLYPVSFDEQASISGWRATLRKFHSWGKDTLFIPGHGQVCGPEGVQLCSDLFDDIEEQARKLHRAGVPASDAADLYVVPEKYKNIVIFAWGFSIGSTITKLYQEWGVK